MLQKQFRSNEHKKRNGLEVFITEILHPRDPLNNSPHVMKAKRKEIDALVQRGTWKIVMNEDVSLYSNTINGRFVMKIKDIETDEPYFKARFVAQATETVKNLHLHTTLRQYENVLFVSYCLLLL